MLTATVLILLFLSSVLGGIVNAIAGGGSFFTFPMLLFAGVPIVNANATSTLALWPGSIASAYAYRKELDSNRNVLFQLCFVSLVGSIIGTVLLLRTPSDTLERMIPYLLLASTLILFFKNRIANSRLSKGIASRMYAVLLLQLIIAIYGGYFGGGIGILMLATFNLMGFVHLLKMNAMKTLLQTLINGVASIIFIIYSKIVWPLALVMILGGVAGGLIGGHLGKSISPKLLNHFVIFTGFFLTVWFFIKAYQ